MSANLMARQRGMTMISWLVVLTIAMFFILVSVKMIPTYLENYSISQVLKGLQDDRNSQGLSRAGVKRTVLKRFKINGVYDFREENLKITPVKNGLNISADYEVRKHVLGNVYIVMTFTESVDLKR